VNTEVAAGDRGGPPSLQHEDVEFESPPTRCEMVPRASGTSGAGDEARPAAEDALPRHRGHRHPEGGFDADMLELQRDFLLGVVGPFLCLAPCWSTTR